jgi:Protein of unknown function (DUF3300)
MAKTRPILSCFLSAMLAFMMPALEGCNRSKTAPSSTSTSSSSSTSQAPATTYSRPSADELYQMVAPIALFPDNLVAQVLAGSTYPDEIASAATWLQQNASLKGNDLMQAVNQESWDVSVKGLTQFPDVLKQMASNLSWTSALGDAYFNIPQDVMNAIQVMRQRASQAGNLKSGAQQTVTTEPSAPQPQQASSDQQQQPQPTVVQAPPQTIVIQAAQPDVVYVPSYNPTVVYGAPVAVYPGYVAPPPPSTGELVATGLISFGLGMAVGAAMNNNCCGWGYNSWGCGWNNSSVTYNRNVYVSNSNTFVNRSNYYNRNANSANINNINRNNYNNVNRNNYNANNINRNNTNNYRANNFNNTARNSNFTTPNFGTARNEAQYRNVNGASLQGSGASNRMNNGQQLGQNANRQPVQQAGNRQPLGQNANRQPVQQATGREQLGQNANRQTAGQNQNRQQMAQNQNRPNVNQAERGYGQQQRGTNSGAFNNYSQGGNARVNSARGQESLSGTRQGGNRPEGGTRQAGGGNRQGGGNRSRR